MTFEGTEDETCLLSGFTIRNGSTTGSGGGICGGTEASHTHATMRNNVIAGNCRTAPQSGMGFGGGIGLCDGIIENNTITGNSAAMGGGVLGFCNGIMQNNLITGNTADGYRGNGGGVHWCCGLVRNNVISGNSATGSEGCGDGVCFNANAVNNEVRDNWARQYGGGMSNCGCWIQGNTITGNSAGRAGRRAGPLSRPRREQPHHRQFCPTWGRAGLVRGHDPQQHNHE